MSELSFENLKPAKGSRTSFKRIGRGHGSGRGTTAGRGTKGQGARTGGRKGLKRWALRRLILSLPKKRGFHSMTVKSASINLRDLAVFPEGVTITFGLLLEKKIVKEKVPMIKVLGQGNAKKWTLKGLEVSASAKDKIEKAGGSIQ